MRTVTVSLTPGELRMIAQLHEQEGEGVEITLRLTELQAEHWFELADQEVAETGDQWAQLRDKLDQD